MIRARRRRPPAPPVDESISEYQLRTIGVGVITTVIALLTLVLYPMLPGGYPIEPRLYVLVLIAATAAVAVVAMLPWRWLVRRGLAQWALYLWSAVDIVLVTLAVRASGSHQSEAYIFYGLIIIFFAASYPLTGQVVLFGFSIAAYAGILAMDESVVIASLFFRVVSLAAVLYLSSFLARELRNQMRERSRANTEAQRRAHLLAVVAASARADVATPREAFEEISAAIVALGFDAAGIAVATAEDGTWQLERANGQIPVGPSWWRYRAHHHGGIMVWNALEAENGQRLPTTLAIPFPLPGQRSTVLLAGRRSTAPVDDVEVEALELLAARGARVLEAAQYTERLGYQATHDGLTGLPNRLLVINVMDGEGLRPGGAATVGAVFYLDLDEFKRINDLFGYQMGDRLLNEVGARLSGLEVAQLVGRLSADEFVVIAEAATPEELAACADTIRGAFGAPFVVEGVRITLAATIGIALPAGDATEQLRQAGTAMFCAKAAHVPAMVFAPSMDIDIRARHEMDRDFRESLTMNEFEVFFQPIIELTTGRLVGFESLVRWRRQDGNLVSPGTFIPFAEDTGLVVPLGKLMISMSLAQLSDWRARLPAAREIVLSINVSALQLLDAGFPEELRQLLDAFDTPPAAIKLEITEATLANQSGQTATCIAELRDLGVAIALDDFGTGYSSLGYLGTFRVDTLKIDQSFVRRLGQDRDADALVRAILDLARSFQMSVVAEGIETEEQRAFLEAHGCTYGQGYLFGRPLASPGAELLLLAAAA